LQRLVLRQLLGHDARAHHSRDEKAAPTASAAKRRLRSKSGRCESEGLTVGRMAGLSTASGKVRNW
jgi:hypothetical protein